MIQMIGIDHNNAPVDVRALFAFRASEMAVAMNEIKNQANAEGIVVISTCNRVEIWTDKGCDADALVQVFCKYKGLDVELYDPYFRRRESSQAEEHLFLLACGLKSAMLAEDQILTQVKEASDFAREQKLSSSTLEVLFKSAITAAKKIKTEVKFEHANASAIEQAISMLKSQGFDFKGKKCMVIGNGAYGKLSATTLMEEGCEVTVTIRQYHSGEVLIPKGCNTILYGDKYQVFSDCDLVVSATTSPNYTLFYDAVSDCQIKHPMILLDLAVPRDIDPMIKNLPDFTVYDIDDFATEESEENAAALVQAKQIIDAELEEYHTWLDFRDVIPMIGTIREIAAEDIAARIGKPLRKLDVDDRQRKELAKQIKTASGKVVSNIFFRLRDSLDEETFRQVVKQALEDAKKSLEE